MTTEKQSTPITAEGLRGLGMRPAPDTQHGPSWAMNPNDDCGVVYWERDGSVTYVCMATEYLHTPLGTAPDLETIGRLIDVLRRMNGGDVCSI